MTRTISPPPSAELEKKRLVNIELLRIAAMFMIVLLHCNNFGKLLENAQPLTGNWFAVWTVESLSIVAVNCYVFISGYFLVDSRFRLRKLVQLWLQIVFYAVVLSAAMGALYGHIGLGAIMSSVLPLSFDTYWFASVYATLYILSPFINAAIGNMSKRQLRNCAIIMVGLFCVWPSTIPFVSTKGGYDIVWFVTVYVVAAYVRLYVTPSKAHRKYYLAAYFSVTVLALAARAVGSCCYFPWMAAFQKYNGLGVLFAAISLCLFFLTVRIDNARIGKAVLSLSGLTFGVYLIHEHFMVRSHLYTDWLRLPDFVDSPLLVPYVFLCAAAIYCTASAVEFGRRKLFALLNVDRGIDRVLSRLSVSKAVGAIKRMADRI